MASPKRPRVAPGRHAVPAVASDTGVLPLDSMYEILLRLPAKELCRLRIVCRSWRSLLSDPHFIAAHAFRHPGPLFFAGYYRAQQKDGVIGDIVDISGRVVKHVHTKGNDLDQWMVSSQLDLICMVKIRGMRCRLLNPATGVVCSLPEELAKEHAKDEPYFHHIAMVTIVHVDSTVAYKVLRVLENRSDDKQLYEVLSLDGSSSSRWRGKGVPPDTGRLRLMNHVVVDGIAFFVMHKLVLEKHAIASFDLKTEEWRKTLQGPPLPSEEDTLISIVALNGCLAVVHESCFSLDLWFLMDIEKGLWVKQHSMQIKFYEIVHPLLALNDDRIVLHMAIDRILGIYSPRTCTYTEVAETAPYAAISVYTGNLLSLPNGGSL